MMMTLCIVGRGGLRSCRRRRGRQRLIVWRGRRGRNQWGLFCRSCRRIARWRARHSFRGIKRLKIDLGDLLHLIKRLCKNCLISIKLDLLKEKKSCKYIEETKFLD